MSSTAPEVDLEFECPRCNAVVTERFWGPCTPCRDQLRSAVVGEAQSVESVRFEPAMHVQPNHVATKD